MTLSEAYELLQLVHEVLTPHKGTYKIGLENESSFGRPDEWHVDIDWRGERGWQGGTILRSRAALWQFIRERMV